MQGSVLEWLTMAGEWAIVAAILYEGGVALKEYRSARLFDAIKYLEDTQVRDARRILYQKLKQNPPSPGWWKSDTVLQEAAAMTCARYNLIGAVTRKDRVLRKFIVTEWANNIFWTYEVLDSYVKYRETSITGQSGMFRHYQALYAEARNRLKLDSAVNAHWEQSPN